MPLHTSGGFRLSYDDRGSGPVLLWVPGTGLLGSTWRDQVDHFADRYRCLSVDLRGSGQTTAEGEFTVADLAADLAGLLDALGVERATVAGVSLGSAVAQELALARPDLVERLVLVSTWSSTAREHHIRRHFESRLFALERGPLEVYAQFAFWMSSPWLYDHEPDLRADVESRLRAALSDNLAGTAAHFRADLGHETRDRLGQVTCPTLVAYGADDLITLPWYNQAVADQVPGAQVVQVPKAGHLMWLERTAVLTRAIEDFLTHSAGRAADAPPTARP